MNSSSRLYDTPSDLASSIVSKTFSGRVVGGDRLGLGPQEGQERAFLQSHHWWGLASAVGQLDVWSPSPQSLSFQRAGGLPLSAHLAISLRAQARD